MRILIVLGVYLFALAVPALAEPLSDQTIVGIETEEFFYANGKMEKSAGQFENTYFLSGDSKEVIPDETVYQVQSQLSSHPGKESLGLPSVIRAIGQPGMDAVEVLVIGDDFIQSCKSTSTYFVISRFKRLK